MSEKLEQQQPPETVKLQGIGLVGSIANMAKSAISSGLLLFPRLFFQSGSNWIALVYLTLISVCSHFAIMFLAISAQVCEVGDFTSLTTRVFTRSNGEFRLFERICVNSLTPAIAFVKMAVAARAMKLCTAEFVSSFIYSLEGKEGAVAKNWIGNAIAICLSIGITFPLTFVKDMRKLATISFVGTAVLAYILVITLTNYFGCAVQTGQYLAQSSGFSSMSSFRGFCTMLLCFAGHPSVPNIVKGMRNATKARIFSMSAVSISICALMYGITGFAGRNTPGINVEKLVYITTMRHDPNDVDAVKFVPDKLFHVGGLIISFVLCITCPLVMFPARTAIECMLFPTAKASETKQPKELISKNMRYHLINVILSSFSIAVGLLPIQIDIVTTLIGSIVGSCLVLVLPSFCVLKLKKRHVISLTPMQRIFIWVNLTIGVVCFLGIIPWTIVSLIR